MVHSLPRSLAPPADPLSSLLSMPSSQLLAQLTRQSVSPESDNSERQTPDNFSGERLTRNLYLFLDSDRSHPMFLEFLLTVQKLEQAMLG